jgi:hypothetical protein
MAYALRPHVSAPNKSSTRVALDVARNVATALILDGGDACELMTRSLRARAALGWISVGDVEAAAVEAGRAWHRTVAAGGHETWNRGLAHELARCVAGARRVA